MRRVLNIATSILSIYIIAYSNNAGSGAMRYPVLKYLSILSFGRSRPTNYALSFCSLSKRARLSLSTCIHRAFDIPIGNSGRISLDVTQPSTSQNQACPNVIIHLPAGPLFHHSAKDSHANRSAIYDDRSNNASALALATSSTVVTVNYRLGVIGSNQHNHENHYQYPFPVHDTLAAFDWVQNTFQPSHLGILGTHIGGSLALMLSLTESQSISAVAALEPICDWTELDEHCIQDLEDHDSVPNKTRTVSTSKFPDLVPLLEARGSLFSTPERYFDAFASPALFLRSAGQDVPKVFPRYKYLTENDYPAPVSALESRSKDLVAGSTGFGDPYIPSNGDWDPLISDSNTVDEEMNNDATRRRKSLSRWPPYGLDYGLSGASRGKHRKHRKLKYLKMALPWVRIFVRSSEPFQRPRKENMGLNRKASHFKNPSHGSILALQADEMVDVMRKACFWGREKGHVENRVTLVSVPSEKGLDRGESMAGKWVGDMLKAVHTNR